MTAFKNFSLVACVQAPAKLTRIQQLRKVAAFARQLMRHGGLTLGEAMTYAWDEMKKYGKDYQLVKFQKQNGDIVSRVVMFGPAHNYIKVKGTGRPLKPGQVWFADAARMHAGKRNIAISTYSNLIIEQF